MNAFGYLYYIITHTIQIKHMHNKYGFKLSAGINDMHFRIIHTCKWTRLSYD